MDNATGTSGNAFPRANGSRSENVGIETLGIDGVGLIGGSIAAAVKSRGLCRLVLGFGRSAGRLEIAREEGLIDDCSTDYRAAAKVDLLVCCLPVDRIGDAVRSAAKYMRPGTTVTDAGSVKVAVCAEIGSEPAPGIAFVGSHPLAGSEKQGFEHADAGLFAGRTCIVTPTEMSNASAVSRIAEFWRGLGSNVVTMPPAEHDRIMARTSHVPHAIAAAIAAGLANGEEHFAASGFRDMTRIAGGDPRLWTGILLANREAVSAEMNAFIERCEAISSALASSDAQEVERLLVDGQRRRKAFAETFQ
ncbi:MAG: prephenate dehydrogenase/arogenate dehydrogenase family protein [Planctomycetota bacterium]|nr:prephenate dehydrogenase/arogenate dehydrogenase family protein [Planctomycetaceae bacterium]MDQ3329049.1 prephenate dehydrogenase/arogenate dehydrogenase family protein [Planctomycetota bacterium]